MPVALYVRLFTDARGESHFEDIELELAIVDYAPPASPLGVAAFLPTTDSRFVGAASTWDGGWHQSPRRLAICTLRGEYEVEASDGACRRFPQGCLLIVEDTTGKGHSTRVIGKEDMLLLHMGIAD